MGFILYLYEICYYDAMLNVFPELLFLSFFAPLMLRAVLGFVLLSYSLNRLYRRKREFEGLFLNHFPLNEKTLLLAVGILELVFGLGLIAGLYTQIIALGVILLSLTAILGKNPVLLFRSSRLIYFFMFGISISLLLSGAGGFAFDLPL